VWRHRLAHRHGSRDRDRHGPDHRRQARASDPRDSAAERGGGGTADHRGPRAVRKGAAQTVTAPLEGVKVVDIATLGAGPWLATRLADFGADVIKVEHPSAGDPIRLLRWFDG